MGEFTSTAEAFRVARERASVAGAMEAQLLQAAVLDAREAGMSIREAAATLRVPKSTIARHWREDHQRPSPPPTWGSEQAWREAHAAVWAHDERELGDDWVPYEWSDDGTSRTVRGRFRGVAIARPWRADEEGYDRPTQAGYESAE